MRPSDVTSAHARRFLAVVAGALLLTGCGATTQPSVSPGRYTCAQLARDFRSRSDAPGDRGQAVLDALTAKVKNPDRASANVRDELVYQLASTCARRDPQYRPTRSALRAVQRQFASQ